MNWQPFMNNVYNWRCTVIIQMCLDPNSNSHNYSPMMILIITHTHTPHSNQKRSMGCWILWEETPGQKYWWCFWRVLAPSWRNEPRCKYSNHAGNSYPNVINENSAPQGIPNKRLQSVLCMLERHRKNHELRGSRRGVTFEFSEFFFHWLPVCFTTDAYKS